MKNVGYLNLVILFFVLSFIVPAYAQVSEKELFINTLVQKMTLEEKIGQLSLFTSDWSITGPTIRDTYKEDIKAGKVGAIFNAYTVEYVKGLQRIAVEETRLAIPMLFGYDVIHGHRTIFPIPLATSCSWDLAAIENIARIAASEASAEGINWTFAPMVDIVRDPRWGRVSESGGEDPYLGSLIAAALVKGFQGNNYNNANTILACAKHFAAYGAAEGGRDYNTVDLAEQTLREFYLPQFKACAEAGVGTFMTAFNEINGVPATGNKFLITDILKDEWQFKGFVVTDYTSINEMVPHGFAINEQHAGELAINAGVDMDMQGAVFNNFLQISVANGAVSISKIDEAVKRILRIKYDLGLFTDPYRYCNIEREKNELMTKQNLEAARNMCGASIVLLKNKNHVLPLKKSGTVALIGPLADDKRNLIGNWSAAGDWNKSIPVLEGFKNKASENFTILYAKGANILDDTILIKKLNSNGGDIKPELKSAEQLLNEAIAIAKQSDVVVMVLGETQGMSGEAASRSDIGLPENQMKLLKAIYATGKPVVLVLMNGRPLTLSWEDEHIDAIVETWFGGTEAGNAIADVLFGDYNPSAKLTMSFPRNVGQIPVYYNAKNTGRPFNADSKYTSKYLDIENTPLYPFGYGLSYTTFTYSAITLNKSNLISGDTITASVTITNSGNYAGEEIVQLYIRDKVASITRPVKELKGFQKIYLKKGESKIINFIITDELLKFYNGDLEYTTEPGAFEIMIGTNSSDVRSINLNLL